MRIVLVNWAKIWDGAGYGGGVNGYCQSLALALRERGHEVISLCGGRTYMPPCAPGEKASCFVRRHDDWLGVRVFEVINSPVMAPSIVQFQQPMGEVSSPELEAEVGGLFGLLKPSVVHFHNLEGFSIGCVRRARDAGARVFFSLHNYHTICPQVYLVQGHRVVCHDYDNGHNCVGCIKTETPAFERERLAAGYAADLAVAQRELPAGKIRAELGAEWAGFKHEFTWPIRVFRRAQRLLCLRAALRSMGAPRESAAGPPGIGVLTEHDALDPRPCLTASYLPTHGAAPMPPPPGKPLSPDNRGQTQGLLAELAWKPPTIDIDSPERRPLINLALADPPSANHPNEYARRRAAMLEMLNGCHAVLAVSDFVRDKFIAMGVAPAVIRTMHIGSRINRVVARASALVFDPPPFAPPSSLSTQDSTPIPQRRVLPETRPIRLVFMGYNNYYKGIHILVEALEMLTPEYLGRIDLSIFALDGQSIEWLFRRMEPRLARLTFTPGYQYHDIPWMLGGKDLGVVPSVWWDNAPQTVFEFFACRVPVLAAAVGGIPDFVKDGENGLLFRGNDPWDMARRLAGAIREPWRLTEMRARVRPPKDIDEHAVEIEDLYLGTRNLTGPGAQAPATAPIVSVARPPRIEARAVSP